MNCLKACTLLTSLLTPLALCSEESPWDLTGAAGLSYTDGNSDTLSYSLQFLGSYENNGNTATVGADYFYSEDGEIKSTDSLKIFSQYNRDLSDRTYLGGYGSYLRDNVADIDYRVDTSVLFGYRVIEGTNANLSFEAGPGYSWEERGGMQRDFATLRFVEKFEYRFNELTKFWQSFGITPKVEDVSDYLLDFELGLDTRITDQWSLRTFMKHRIDSTPAADKGRTDTSVMLGMKYDFMGLSEIPANGSLSLFPRLGSVMNLDDDWKSVAALGFTMTSGNSDSLGFDFSWDSEYRSDEREFFFEIAQTLKENNGESSEDQTISRVQYNHFVSERAYLGATLGYLRDNEADINYRITPGVIVGRYLVKNETTNLAFEAGPAYTFESVDGTNENYFSGVIAERFSHQFNERFSFKQSAEFVAEVSDLENHSLLVSASFDTRLSERLSWKVGGRFSFENRPAPDKEREDIALTSSIAMQF